MGDLGNKKESGSFEEGIKYAQGQVVSMFLWRQENYCFTTATITKPLLLPPTIYFLRQDSFTAPLADAARRMYTLGVVHSLGS